MDRLIREGATLIQNAADVAEALGPIGDMFATPSGPRFQESAATVDANDAARRDVTGLLGPVPVPVDELIRLSSLPPAIVQTVLLELELAGRLERHSGNRVSLGG